MRISTSDLKQELTQWQEELRNQLSVRIHTILDEIKEDDLSKAKEICLTNLIVRTIFKADKGPANYISDLLILANPKSNCGPIDEWTISDSATFISNYLKKDYVLYSL